MRKKGPIMLRKSQRRQFVIMSLWVWESLRITWLFCLVAPNCKCPYQTGAKWPTSYRAILYHNRWMDFSHPSLVSTHSSHTGPRIPDIVCFNWVLQSICPSTKTKRRTLTGSINLLIPPWSNQNIQIQTKILHTKTFTLMSEWKTAWLAFQISLLN